jgi:two-component system, response regulator PdtaR
MMNQSHVLIVNTLSDQRIAGPPFRPQLVFSSEGMSGAARVAPDAARVLIVEDEFLVALQIEGALKDAGHEVGGIASSAEDALKLAEAERPTLVVMDIRLAGKRDGIDAALELFSKYRIRCVFASAHQDEDVRLRAEPAEPLGWLRKPYTMHELVKTVQAALARLRDEPA